MTFCTCAPSVAPSVTERAFTPRSAWRTDPVRISSSAIPRAVSIGIAKPSPIEPPSLPDVAPMLRIAVLMPITAPVESTSGPPELPGLIAASVWMASITASAPESPASSRTGRSSALTMPWVTVPTRPSGEPMAITASPTASPADDPIAATTGFATSTLTTARSVFGSRPTIRAGARVPSAKTASSRLPAPAAAGATTWLLVST